MAKIFLPGRVGFDPQQKPEQWGDVETVRNAVRHNCDKLGLPTPVWMLPYWEKAGTVVNDIFSKASLNINNLSWDDIGLDYTGSGYANASVDVFGGYPFTIHFLISPFSAGTTTTFGIACNTVFSFGASFGFYVSTEYAAPDYKLRFSVTNAAWAAAYSLGDVREIGNPSLSVVCVARSITNRQLYVAGIPGPIDSVSQAYPNGVNALQTGWLARNSNWTEAGDYSGSIHAVTGFKSALDSFQVALLYEQPYLLLQKPPYVRYFEVGVAGGTPVLKIISETSGASDALSKGLVLIKVNGETVGAVDSTGKVLGLAKVLSESAPATDAYGKLLDIYKIQPESAPAGDELAKALALNKIVPEAPAADDATSKLLALTKTEDESAQATDSQAKVTGIAKVLTELADAIDSYGKLSGVVKVLSAVAGAIDSTAKRIAINKAWDETVTAIETTSKKNVLKKVWDEAAGAVDSAARALGLVKVITAIAGAADLVVKALATLGLWQEEITLDSDMTIEVTSDSDMTTEVNLNSYFED